MIQEMFLRPRDRHCRCRGSSGCSACSTWPAAYLVVDWTNRAAQHLHDLLRAGHVLYASVPDDGRMGLNRAVRCRLCRHLQHVWRGFADHPGVLEDTFGTMHVGASTGACWTAWSVAGVLGPALVTIHPRLRAEPGGRDDGCLSSLTMYLMAGFSRRLHRQLADEPDRSTAITIVANRRTA